MVEGRKVEPFISVVTVAYNMEDTVRDTLESITQAKTSNVEYIFIDGKSSDNTMQIANKFKDSIDLLISEPDSGQYDAINKGMRYSKGEILCWLNADDIVMPWTFKVVEAIFRQFPEVSWITGQPSFLNGDGHLTRIYSKAPAYPQSAVANGWYDRDHGSYLQQESMFWRRSLWESAGGIDTSYTLAADFHLWTKFGRFAQLVPVDIPLAAFRERPGAQRSSRHADLYENEVRQICLEHRQPGGLWRLAAKAGIVPRSLIRYGLTAKGQLIAYDRAGQQWRKIERRRSLARVTLGNLIDEHLLRIR